MARAGTANLKLAWDDQPDRERRTGETAASRDAASAGSDEGTEREPWKLHPASAAVGTGEGTAGMARDSRCAKGDAAEPWVVSSAVARDGELVQRPGEDPVLECLRRMRAASIATEGEPEAELEFAPAGRDVPDAVQDARDGQAAEDGGEVEVDVAQPTAAGDAVAGDAAAGAAAAGDAAAGDAAAGDAAAGDAAAGDAAAGDAAAVATREEPPAAKPGSGLEPREVKVDRKVPQDARRVPEAPRARDVAPPARVTMLTRPKPPTAPPPKRRAVLPVVGVVAFAGAMLGLVAVFTGDDTRAPASGVQAPPAAAPAADPVRGAARAPRAAPAADRPEPALPAGPAGEHLARARSLAAANEETVLNSTREGARQAEVEALEAFRLGGADIPGAWRILADAFHANIEWTPDTDGRAEYRRKEREALGHVLEADPRDGEARFRYAMLLEERGARILELNRAVRDLPQDAGARRVLADDLLLAGRIDEGARLLVEAAQLYTPQDLKRLGPGIAGVLQKYGREQEAAQVRSRMQQLGL